MIWCPGPPWEVTGETVACRIAAIITRKRYRRTVSLSLSTSPPAPPTKQPLMRYIIYVPSTTLLPRKRARGCPRAFRPRNHLLWALFARFARFVLSESSSSLTSNYPECYTVIRSIMLPVTGIVRDIPCIRPLEYPWTGWNYSERGAKCDTWRIGLLILSRIKSR